MAVFFSSFFPDIIAKNLFQLTNFHSMENMNSALVRKSFSRQQSFTKSKMENIKLLETSQIIWVCQIRKKLSKLIPGFFIFDQINDADSVDFNMLLVLEYVFFLNSGLNDDGKYPFDYYVSGTNICRGDGGGPAYAWVNGKPILYGVVAR